ncbi:hypothetical protein LXL04_023901 [Taraxacum kok-saghyz]
MGKGGSSMEKKKLVVRILYFQTLFYSKWGESRSFENSYIPENPRTPKPLTFSKNRLRGAKNRSNISPVAKKNFRKNDFFFPKTLHMCKKKIAYVHSFLFCLKNAQIHEMFLNFFYMSLYNTYLKGLVQKNLKENAKKKVAYMHKNKNKSCTYAKQIVIILNVLEGPEVGFLKGITGENSYIPENPRTPPISYISQTVIPFKKPTSGLSKTFFLIKLFKYVFSIKKIQKHFVFLSAKKKNLPICKVFEKKKLFFRKFFFATRLKFERLLAPEVGFSKKLTISKMEENRTEKLMSLKVITRFKAVSNNVEPQDLMQLYQSFQQLWKNDKRKGDY